MPEKSRIFAENLIHNDMKNLTEFLQENPNVTIEVSGAELLEVVRNVATEVVEHCTKAEQPEEYLTRKQTAKKFGVTLTTLWRWHNTGYLQHIPIGGSRKYRLSDVQRILQQERGSVHR